MHQEMVSHHKKLQVSKVFDWKLSGNKSASEAKSTFRKLVSLDLSLQIFIKKALHAQS